MGTTGLYESSGIHQLGSVWVRSPRGGNEAPFPGRKERRGLHTQLLFTRNTSKSWNSLPETLHQCRVFAGFYFLNHFPPPALLMFNHQRLHLTPKNDLRMKDQRWRQNKTTRSCSVFLRKRREGWTKREERKNASQAQSERS